jgi:hypothetical protein
MEALPRWRSLALEICEGALCFCRERFLKAAGRSLIKGSARFGMQGLNCSSRPAACTVVKHRSCRRPSFSTEIDVMGLGRKASGCIRLRPQWQISDKSHFAFDASPIIVRAEQISGSGLVVAIIIEMQAQIIRHIPIYRMFSQTSG